MRLTIVTGIWKRHNIFELFAKGVNDLKQLPIEIECVVSGSEGARSSQLVAKHGFKYIEVPNEPLSHKMNEPIKLASLLDSDYVLCMGSDDILSPKALDVYLSGMKQGADFIGVTDFYFFDTTSKRSAYWGGYREPYRKGVTCGAGRMLSRRLLNKWGWSVFEYGHDNVLDNSIDQKLRYTDHSRMIFSLKELGVYGVDIKSTTNMTPFKLWDNTQYIENEELLKEFPYLRDCLHD